ncbi:MAG: prepilin-type N-terminal cleavage/methylation domain-containing protein [Candidatus Saccharimonadales bacterium]
MQRINQKGFTIIELLIVIVVIGILAMIGFVAYGNVTKSARDSDRQADASALAKKAEEYYASNGIYPDLAQLSAMDGIDSKTTTSPSGLALADGGTTIGSCTTAPTSKANDAYCYAVLADGSQMSVGYWNEKSGTTAAYINGVNN